MPSTFLSDRGRASEDCIRGLFDVSSLYFPKGLFEHPSTFLLYQKFLFGIARPSFVLLLGKFKHFSCHSLL